MKGFLRRERYITHVRIHTGEKPFVCGVCSRGYRDKRELKKHQATHNHIDQNPESPTSVSSATMTPTTPNQITVMSPARTVSGLSPTKTITVSAAHHAPNNSMATITFSLPTEPVPKNQLGMAPEPVFSAPLNPAHIQLPPSVATALQNMNQKAKPTGLMLASTPVKQESVTQISGGHVLKQIQGVIEGGDGTQLALAGGSFPGLMAAGGGPQVFYYVMPSNVQPLITDGGRGSGEGATQFVALPAGALQASVPVSSVNGSFPQWIIGMIIVYIFFCIIFLSIFNDVSWDNFVETLTNLHIGILLFRHVINFRFVPIHIYQEKIFCRDIFLFSFAFSE